MKTLIAYRRQQNNPLFTVIFFLLFFPQLFFAQSLPGTAFGVSPACETDGVFIIGIITNATCPEVNNGTIQTTPYSGSAPYSYLWNTGDTNSAISDLSPGAYTLTVTDALGLTGSETFIVEDTPVPPLYVDLSEPLYQDEPATFTAEAGYANYHWALNDPTDSIMQGQGTYAVTIKWGANGSKNIRCDFNNTLEECSGTVIYNAMVETFVATYMPEVFAGVSISPNPFTDFIDVQNEGDFPLNTSLQLRDVTGKSLLHKEISGRDTTLEMSQLNPGVYFLYLQGGSAAQTWRMVKQ